MPKILIVEDNFDNLTLVRLLLEKDGYQVVFALNGKEGLDLARSEKPDLIALDLDMPVIDGWQFLSQAKGDPDIQDIPIVVVTAHLLPGERNRVLQAGADGYVSKPFRVDDLANEILRHLAA